MALGPDLNNRAKLVMTDQTTLRDLKDFTDKLGAGTTLRAVTKDGHTVLYAKTDQSGGKSLLSRLFGPARRRENLARKEISDLIGKNREKLIEKGSISRGSQSELLMRVAGEHFVLSRNNAYTKEDPLSAKDVKVLVDTATAIYAQYSNETDKSVSERLDQLLDGKARSIVRDFAREIKTGQENKATKSASQLADLLAAKLEGPVRDLLKKSQKSPVEFVAKELSHLRNDLLYAIKSELKDLAVHMPTSYHDLSERAIDKAVTNLSATLLEVPVVETLDSITVEGKVYQLDGVIAEGSFGVASKYVDRETGESIAVKLSHGSMDDGDGMMFMPKGDFSNTNMVEEFIRHKEIQGNDPHPNILQVKEMFKLENGGVGVSMELAPHGTAFDIGQKIAQIPKGDGFVEGRCELYALRMIKDMATGLQDIQARNFVHGDFKTPNVFVGEGGVMKIADFGTAQGGGKLTLVEGVKVENPTYLAPEVVRGQDSLERVDKLVDLAKKNFDKEFVRMYADNYGDVHGELADFKDEFTSFHRDDFRPEQRQMKSDRSVGPKSDVWAVGVSLYELATGRQFIANPKFPSLHARKLSEFQSGVAIGENGHFGFPSTGNKDLDRLINRMLDPVPSKRPSMDEVLRDPLLTDVRLDDPRLRNEIVALSSSDPTTFFEGLNQNLGQEIRVDLQQASNLAGRFLSGLEIEN